MSVDYRRPEHREAYFTALYKMNLEEKVMPGLVYLYMPELAWKFGWGPEEKLWFALLNGLTQSPITSLRIFAQQPHVPRSEAEVVRLDTWFSINWSMLHFDADRLKNKRNTIPGIRSYCHMVWDWGTQAALWARTDGTYAQYWEQAQKIYGMGRLSCFSYLEYVKIMGFGTACTDLMLNDRDGSRSHRNGLLFLLGRDDLVWDKRANNGFDGKYADFERLCGDLDIAAWNYLGIFTKKYPHILDAGNFTFESQCCQFKNGFFGRRYPGVYADMAWDRIKWYDERGVGDTQVFKDIREEHLPNWLREEAMPPVKRSDKAKQFIRTGTPYNAQYFMGEENAYQS